MISFQASLYLNHSKAERIFVIFNKIELDIRKYFSDLILFLKPTVLKIT